MKTIIAASLSGVLILAGLITAIASAHVDRYYVSSAHTGQISSVTCAWAHWSGWHTDEIAFCSDDANKVVEWVAKANTSLK
jgi:hypothetical protein